MPIWVCSCLDVSECNCRPLALAGSRLHQAGPMLLLVPHPNRPIPSPPTCFLTQSHHPRNGAAGAACWWLTMAWRRSSSFAPSGPGRTKPLATSEQVRMGPWREREGGLRERVEQDWAGGMLRPGPWPVAASSLGALAAERDRQLAVQECGWGCWEGRGLHPSLYCSLLPLTPRRGSQQVACPAPARCPRLRSEPDCHGHAGGHAGRRRAHPHGRSVCGGGWAGRKGAGVGLGGWLWVWVWVWVWV